MSKVIETTLRADSSQLRKDFAEAEKSTLDYEKRQQRISTMPRRGAEGLPGLPELNPGNLREMERAAALQGELRRRSIEAGKGAKNGSMGFLAFSQAVEDSQYGIRGVLNNIPQMVMGFGGSMGLAGAVSLAAVGLVTYQKLIAHVSGDDRMQKRLEVETEAWKEYDKAIYAAQDRFKQAKLKADLDERMEARLEKEASLLTGLIGLDKERFRILEREGQLRDGARQREQSLLKAAEAYTLERGKTEEDRRSVETRVTDINAQREQKRLAEEIAEEEKKKAEAGKQYNRIQDGMREKLSQYQREIGEANNGLDDLRRRLDPDEAEANRLRKVIPEAANGQEANNDRRNLAIIEERIEKTRKLVAERDAVIAQNKQLLASTLGTGRAAKADLDEQLRTSKGKIDALNEQLKVNEQLSASEKARLKLQHDRERAEEAAKRAGVKEEYSGEMAALKQELAGHKEKADAIRRESEARRGAAAFAKDLGVSEKQALEMLRAKAGLVDRIAKAEQDRRRKEAVREIGGDLSVLRLQAAGREREAKALQREIDLRNEAHKIAEQMGISEAKALGIVRERQKLEDRIEANKNRRPRSGIYKLDADESTRRHRIDAGNGRRIEASPGRRIGFGNGLRTTAQERERSGRLRDPAVRDRAAAARYYDRSIAAQESMVGIFQQMGVI